MNDPPTVGTIHRVRNSGLAVGLLVFIISGCARNRTKVPDPIQPFNPEIHVKKLPSPPKRKPSEATGPWYETLNAPPSTQSPRNTDQQPANPLTTSSPNTSPESTSNKTVVEIVDLDNPQAAKAYWKQKPSQNAEGPQALLQQILEELLAAIPQKASWALLRLELGLATPTERDSLELKAVLVRRSLYTRRPVISFDRIRLEECMTRLATKSGLRHAQARAHNPVISWKREKVTPIEAIQAILDEHNFHYRFSGCYSPVLVELREFDGLEEFRAGALKKILEAGQSMENDVPTLVVRPISKKEKKKRERARKKKADQTKTEPSSKSKETEEDASEKVDP